MDARHAPLRRGETGCASQCGALQAQFYVVVLPRVAAPSGRLTRDYAWYGPPGRTWPISLMVCDWAVKKAGGTTNINHSYETRCHKGRRKSRSNGWAAAGRGFPANCPSEAPGCTQIDYGFSASGMVYRPVAARVSRPGCMRSARVPSHACFQRLPRALVSRPWCGLSARAGETAHKTVFVIHVDRSAPVSPPSRRHLPVYGVEKCPCWKYS